MNKLLLSLSLCFVLLISQGQVSSIIDEELPDRIGVGSHSARIKSISALLAVSLRHNASVDVFRYKNVTNVEYYDGSTWVVDSTEDWKNVLDGNEAGRWSVSHEKVRFVIDLEGTWIRPSAIFIGQDYSGGERQFNLQVESSSDQSTWNLRLADTPTGSAFSGSIFMLDSKTDVDRYIRLTLTSTTDLNDPLLLFRISGFTQRPVGLKGNASLPFYTDFDRNIGIGTTSPSQLLDVSKDQNASTRLRVGNMSTGTGQESGITLMSNQVGFDVLSHNVNRTGSLMGLPRSQSVFLRTHTGSPAARLAIGTGSPAPIHFATSDAVRMTVAADGKVGVGTTAPAQTLDVNGNVGLSRLYLKHDFDQIRFEAPGANRYFFMSKTKTDTKAFAFYSPDDGGWFTYWKEGSGDMIVNKGKVGIGTASPDEKLTVKGKIHSEEVKVDLTVPGPDYVFEPDYELRSLEETEEYIKENKHLPEVPSAKEMEADGIDLGEMNMLLLKKIEELTLHVIELKKENLSQQREIQLLKDRQ